jgi:hypothetical protein
VVRIADKPQLEIYQMSQGDTEIKPITVSRQRALVSIPTRLTIDTIKKVEVRILAVLHEGRGRAPMNLKDVRGVIKDRFWKEYPILLALDPLHTRVIDMVQMGYVARFGSNGYAITPRGTELYEEVERHRPRMLEPSSTPNVEPTKNAIRQQAAA